MKRFLQILALLVLAPATALAQSCPACNVVPDPPAVPVPDSTLTSVPITGPSQICQVMTPAGCALWITPVQAATLQQFETQIAMYQNDYEKMQELYSSYQQLKNETSTLQGLSFSSLPNFTGNMNTSGGDVSSGDVSGSFGSGIIAQVFGQIGQDQQTLSSIFAASQNTQGTTGATQVNGAISSVNGGSAIEETMIQQSQQMIQAQGEVYGLWLQGGNFDLNGDPNAGWGWGQ